MRRRIATLESGEEGGSRVAKGKEERRKKKGIVSYKYTRAMARPG